MSVIILTVDEVMRTLSSDDRYPFVVNDKEVDIVRFALNTGFTDVVLDEHSALRVMYQRPGETEVRAKTLTYHDTDGLRNYYDWQLLSADLTKKGTLTVALCILRTDGDVEEWHTTPCQIRVLDTIHTDDSDEADETITPTVIQRLAVLETMMQRVASGAPIVVSSTSAMTDTSQIYVLSTDGMWYYHNGSAWVAGGEYGAVATDTTLTQSGKPADAKAVGDEFTNLKSAINDVDIEANLGIIPLNLVPDTYITGTGVEAYYANWSSTSFLNVVPGGKLHVYTAARLTYNAFYDENKAFIPGGTFTINIGENYITVPATAHFCRLSGTTINMQNVVAYTDIKSILTATDRKAEFYHNAFDVQAETKKINVYENCALTLGRVYKGVYDSSVSTIKCTDYVQIIPKHKYAVYGGYLQNDYRYYFDTSKNVIGVLPYTDLLTTYPYTQSRNHMIFTAPDDAGYIRINFLASNVSENIVPDGFYFVDITNDSLANIKVLVIGDSISADYYGGYAKWVTDLISDGYFLHPNVKNDSIHATGFVARYSQTTDDTFLARLSTYNQADFDWVVLFGGINDFIQSVDFGTFKSAVDTYFAYLTTNFYNKKLCVFSPLRTATTTANSAGHIQQDYADYIKSVAKSYAIPVLNLTEESGFFPFVDVFKNQWTLLPEGFSEHDGVHPTEAWEKQFLVPIVKDFFRRFYE